MNPINPSNPDYPKPVLLFLYVVALIASSLIPMNRGIRGFELLINLTPTVQNLLHIPAFAILAMLSLQVLRMRRLEMRTSLILVATFSTMFGVIDEIVQIGVPGRYPSLFDMALNAVGVLMGSGVYVFFESRGHLRQLN